jgi:hypothetical protein
MHEPAAPRPISGSSVLAADDPAALAQFYGALLGLAVEALCPIQEPTLATSVGSPCY